jgi:hypothetical protein
LVFVFAFWGAKIVSSKLDVSIEKDLASYREEATTGNPAQQFSMNQCHKNPTLGPLPRVWV